MGIKTTITLSFNKWYKPNFSLIITMLYGTESPGIRNFISVVEILVNIIIP